MSCFVEGLEAGGQLRHLYPYKPVYNFPGYSVINGGELAESMIRQVRDKEIPLVEYQPVTDIKTANGELFQIHTPKQSLTSWVLIYSTGMGLLEPLALGVEGEAELQEKLVYYAIMQIAEWRKRSVAVFGGGNSAVDNDLLLQKEGCQVTLIHKLNKFQAEESSVKQLRDSGCDVFTGCSTSKFSQSGADKITVYYKNDKEGSQHERTVDQALINIGLKPNLNFLDSLALERKGKQLLVDTEMQTSNPGIFACGDVVTHPGKVRLIVTALGEAATAVNKAEQYIKSIEKE